MRRHPVCRTCPNPKAKARFSPPPADYVYPFGAETGSVNARLTVELAQTPDPAAIRVEIPPLKYDKSLLVLLSQDDCKHAAFSCTWAAIHGRPLSDTYYYNAVQMRAGDMPPGTHSLGKTLGSTDGAGNEVRFSFTTTLSPEWSYMDDPITVKKGFTENYYRFFMQKGLVWSNVAEMVNYGTGIAFHDLKTQTSSVDSLHAHFGIAQKLIREHLGGRGCKMLAEPDGNKNYVEAARRYASIRTLTLQQDGVTLRPFAVEDDLTGQPVLRTFAEPEWLRRFVQTQAALPAPEREAVCIGVHGTDRKWAEFLLWLNDTYGQDGDDSVWMPAQEEYYEYNFLRRHARIDARIEGDKMIIEVNAPGADLFYYPSLSIAVRGVDAADCRSVDADAAVTGLSWGAGSDGSLLVNIDCRHALAELAEHFVKLYEEDRSPANREDARYFVGKLRPSDKKRDLLRRLE